MYIFKISGQSATVAADGNVGRLVAGVQQLGKRLLDNARIVRLGVSELTGFVNNLCRQADLFKPSRSIILLWNYAPVSACLLDLAASLRGIVTIRPGEFLAWLAETGLPNTTETRRRYVEQRASHCHDVA